MKQLLTILALVLLVAPEANSQRSINGLFKDYKKGDITFALTVPGWLIKTGMEIVDNYNKGHEVITAQKIINKISKYRVLVADDLSIDTKIPLRKFRDRMAREKFEPYLSIKRDGNNIGVYVREKKDQIEDIFLMVSGKTTVLLHLDTKISWQELEDLNIKEQIENQDFNTNP